jgi:hypothetical protein
MNVATGGQYRQIQSVQLGPMSSVENLGPRAFTLEYVVSGSCRGCNSTSSQLFYHVDVDGNVKDTCPCQGPSITSFQVFLTERLDQMIQDRVLPKLESLDLAAELESAPTCPAFSTFTTSDAIVQLYGCPLTLEASDWTNLAERFKATYNRINSLNAKLCDRFFREIVSATVILPTEGFSSSSSRTTAFVSSSSSAAAAAKHGHNQHRSGFLGPFPTRKRSNIPMSNYFEVRLDITARCRGCDVRDVTLFDQEEDVNFFNSYDDDYFVDTYGSNATTTNDDDGNNSTSDDSLGNNDTDTTNITGTTLSVDVGNDDNGNDDTQTDDGSDTSGEDGDDATNDGSGNSGHGGGNEGDDATDDGSDTSGQSGGNEGDDATNDGSETSGQTTEVTKATTMAKTAEMMVTVVAAATKEAMMAVKEVATVTAKVVTVTIVESGATMAGRMV